ncbi:GNAT family N-acetyltransferase [Bacillus sp. PK3_68]|uniref:GNAT family N-acetyltransferase n=1 Tax=Bacillus sp. PK3_68 TaxID=2027408 RepID=UPI000E7552B3|nr:GNAT family N-acetyltransferase [Bacillus sp. PK3_68]RJS59081.1 GNAT family N-acetyltransferase [Bacillus sp. PK3_68]
MEIRKPSNLEVEEIIARSPQAVYEGTLRKVKPTNKKVEQLIEPLLKKGCSYLIVVEGEELAGWVLFGTSEDQFSDTPIGFIYELFIKETFRGRGFSEPLLMEAINHLKLNGYSEIRLSAFLGNHAIKLYEKLGFSIRHVTMSLNV